VGTDAEPLPKRPTGARSAPAAAVFVALCSLPFNGSVVADASTQEFYRVSDLTLDPDATPSLVGGVVPADPKQWSSIFYALIGEDFCTATLVGDKVLLTAAHCVQGSLNIVIGKGKPDENDGKCTASPDFLSDTTADWALCKMQRSIPGVVPERIDPNLAAVVDQAELLLTGFGCMAASGPGNSGTFSIGPATVVSTPNGTNYIATFGAVAACYGDSGGPAFVGSDTSKQATRFLVSINAKGNSATTTLLSSIGTHAAVCFFQTWTKNNHVSINGRAADLPDCNS
jgi:hypothetical protein